MRSRSSDYWAKREKTHAEAVKKRESKYSSQISDIYLRTYNRCQAQIADWYSKYARDEGISMAEARKRVAQADIKALSAKAAKYVKDKDFSPRANEEMRLYNLTMKINRLEYLKSDIGIELTKSYSEIESFLGDTLTDEARREYIRQAGILGMTVEDKNLPKYAKNVAYGSFQNATFSDRIWAHQEALHAELSRKLSAAIIQGKGARDLARDLKKTFGVSQANAERLMITEIARVQTDVARDSMERNGNEYYVYLATGPHPCDVCKALDGKRFKVEDMEPGVNAPPMHPYCHCSTGPSWDEEKYAAWLDSGAAKNGVSYDDFDASTYKAKERSK